MTMHKFSQHPSQAVYEQGMIPSESNQDSQGPGRNYFSPIPGCVQTRNDPKWKFDVCNQDRRENVFPAGQQQPTAIYFNQYCTNSKPKSMNHK